jgi:hypothetical protein
VAGLTLAALLAVVLGGTLFAYFSYFWSGRFQNLIPRADGDFIIHEDEQGRAVALTPTAAASSNPVYERVGLMLLPGYCASLGFLCGVGLSMVVARLVWPSAGPLSHLWLFGWLCAVMAAWCGTFLFERLVLSRLSDSGQFEEVNPLTAGASFFLWMRRFRSWAIVLMFGAGSLLMLVEPDTLFLGVLMASMCGIIAVRLRIDSNLTIRLSDMSLQLLPTSEFVLSGGWVAPAVMMLCAASFSLAMSLQVQTALLMALINGALLLALWSERASRVRAPHLRTAEWRELLRRRLAARPDPDPGVEPA